MVIQSVLEFVAVLAVLWGIFNEEKIAKWESWLFSKIKKQQKEKHPQKRAQVLKVRTVINKYRTPFPKSKRKAMILTLHKYYTTIFYKTQVFFE